MKTQPKKRNRSGASQPAKRARVGSTRLLCAKSASTIRRNLCELRKVIDTSKDPVETRIAYSMETAIRWVTLETKGWPGMMAEAKGMAMLLKQELAHNAKSERTASQPPLTLTSASRPVGWLAVRSTAWFGYPFSLGVSGCTLRTILISPKMPRRTAATITV